MVRTFWWMSQCVCGWLLFRCVYGSMGKEPRPVPASPWNMQTERGSSRALGAGGCGCGSSDGGERKGNPALSTAHWVSSREVTRGCQKDPEYGILIEVDVDV